VRKLVEDQEGVGRGQEGPEEVGKAVGEGGRSGRTWESNGTLQSRMKENNDNLPFLGGIGTTAFLYPRPLSFPCVTRCGDSR